MPPAKKTTTTVQDGFYAVLGMDLVGFSEWSDNDQMEAIKLLYEWVERSLLYWKLTRDDWRWSPGGDGGHITFCSPEASRKAHLVAFYILELAKAHRGEQDKATRYELRMGIHLGSGREAKELREGTNIWGHGVNTASRITGLALGGQVLVSEEYYACLEKGQKEGYRFSDEPYQRTVKHGKSLKLRNVHRVLKGAEGTEVCTGGMERSQADAQRWRVVGGVWDSAKRDYEWVIRDAMVSNDVVAALTAGKRLLELSGGAAPAVTALCEAVHNPHRVNRDGYPGREHPLFSKLPPPALLKLLRFSEIRQLADGDILFREGDPATTVYFPVFGQALVSWENPPGRARIKPGEIIGETALWIKDVKRTGTVKAEGESLLLQIDFPVFESVVKDYHDLEDEIAKTVRKRTLDNALKNREFFPLLSESNRSQVETILRQARADCLKLPAGQSLDLRRSAYIVYSGRVTLFPLGKERESIELSAIGHFDPKNVVGVFGPESIDGEMAEVREEAVVVSLPHDALETVHDQFPEVGKALDTIWALRNLQITRLRNATQPSI